MTDSKLNIAETVAKSVERVSDSRGLVAIGHALGWGLGALAFALIIVGVAWSPAVKNWNGQLIPKEKCFELRELQGKVFRLNTCTGEAQEVSSTAASASSPLANPVAPSTEPPKPKEQRQ